MPTRALVVSIHDVSPLTVEPVKEILDRLRRLGLNAYSLLVVPNHHRRGHFLEDPGFCAWMLDQARAGCEIVIHGYYHQRTRRAGESLVSKLMTRCYTAGEGEFYDITTPEAAGLLAKARDEFDSLGLHPVGFIAPAWLLSPAGEVAVRDAQFLYTTRIGGVMDMTAGTTFRSQSLVYSVRSGWRRMASRVWNAHLMRQLAGNPLLRVGIHPPDLGHPQIWRQISDSITRALEDRTPMTYEGWIRSGKP